MKGFISKKVKGLVLSVVMVVVSVLGNVSYADADGGTSGSNVMVDRKADVFFVIDHTGSMWDDIQGVKNNIQAFVNQLEGENVDVRVKFYSYGNWNCKRKADAESGWLTKVADATAFLDTCYFGCCSNEAPLEGLGRMFESDFGWRTDATKFCVTLTDETYVELNSHGETSDTIVAKMKQENIYSSVITETSLFVDFSKFVTEPTVESADDGGILADIKGDYAILLKDLAERVIKVIEREEETGGASKIKPLKVKASMIVLKKYSEYEYCVAEMKEDSENQGEYIAGSYSDWQSNPVFKDLSPSTKYSFKIRKIGSTYESAAQIETESSTGARFDEIPKILYEGEVYNIKMDDKLKQMVATSGASIKWSAEGKSDCVVIKKDTVGYGCQMVVRDCQYNSNKLINVNIIANVTYSIKQNNGTYKTKTQTYKRKFQVENEVDAMEIEQVNGTSENVYQNGIIILTTKDKVSIDVLMNQGLAEDTPSRQKMSYVITDKYGFKSKNGVKIARVSSKGILQGVGPGVTYVTVAPSHLYNKYGNCYDFSVTIPVVCPMVDNVEMSFPTSEFNVSDESKDGDGSFMVVKVYEGDTLDLNSYAVYNTTGAALTYDSLVDLGRSSTNVFNALGMKKTWTTSDATVAKISGKGIVQFKSIGYVTITMSPIGGYEISPDTGKKRVGVRPCSVTFKVLSKGESEWQ